MSEQRSEQVRVGEGEQFSGSPRTLPGSSARLLPLMPAHLVGLGAFQVAVLLLCFGPRLAALPLGLFVLLCLVAPFFPSWRLFGPLLRRGPRQRPTVALTFDDGPDPATTAPLLDLLARTGVRATFFVVGERARRHPELVRRLLAEGHGLGNHSLTHDPGLMLRSRRRLEAEIAGGQEVLAALGVRPLAFRPPAGIVNPRLWGVLLRLGLVCVGFSCRGPDLGNRRVRGLAARLLRKVRSGDVLLLHDGPVRDTVGTAGWLREIEQLLTGLQQRGLAVVPLEELLGRPLQEPADRAGGDAVALFYDGLAGCYDEEQRRPSHTPLRRLEQELVLERLGQVLREGDQVLEIGAGTGRFTLELAARGARVTALELSPGMAGQLQRKARQAGLEQIEVLTGDVRRTELGGPYDLICAFSAFEYLRDGEDVLRRLGEKLRPGGHLLLTTAHRSPLRFFVQLGNALRQGVWLEARSRRELRRCLAAAGLEVAELSVHGLRVPLLHPGMLLLVLAHRPG